MTTIQTFCRGCKETVGIPVFDSDYDTSIAAALSRLGVSTCEKCWPTTPPQQRELFPRVVASPHNDP